MGNRANEQQTKKEKIVSVLLCSTLVKPQIFGWKFV